MFTVLLDCYTTLFQHVSRASTFTFASALGGKGVRIRTFGHLEIVCVLGQVFLVFCKELVSMIGGLRQ